jgi:hypothetical protein
MTSSLLPIRQLSKKQAIPLGIQNFPGQVLPCQYVFDWYPEGQEVSIAGVEFFYPRHAFTHRLTADQEPIVFEGN